MPTSAHMRYRAAATGQTGGDEDADNSEGDADELESLRELREALPGGVIFADEQRPARGREAGDATSQRRLRCRRRGRFPATLLERLPVWDQELRDHDD